MATEHLEFIVLHNDGERGDMQAQELGEVVTDLKSWVGFFRMLTTGRPALMTMFIEGEKPHKVKVAKPGALPSDAKFETA